MKRRKLLTLVGSICLTVVLAALLIPGCAPAAPTGEEADCSDVEAKLAASEKNVKDLKGDVSSLEKEIAALKKPAEVYEWRFGSCDTAGSADFQWVLVAFADRLNEVTEGQIDITPYPGGELMPITEMLDGVKMGTIDGFTSWSVYFMGKDPGIEYWCEFPYGVPYSYTDMTTWLYERGGAELYSDWYAEHGVHWIRDFAHGGEPMHASFPINRLADLEGQKMRSTSIAGRVFAELGVAVTTIAAPEIYTALQRGTIDVVEYTTLATNIGMGLTEVAPYTVMPAHSRAVLYSLVVGSEIWDELPQSLRNDIDAVAGEIQVAFIYQQKVFEMDVLADPDAYGIIFNTWPEEDHALLAETSMKVWEAGIGTSDMGDKIIESKIAFGKEVTDTFPYVTAK